MATDPKPYASLDKVWKAFGDLANNKTPAVNGEKTISACFFVGSAVIRPVGPRPAGHGRGRGRVPSQTPSWQTGSSLNLIVMSVDDPTDPWIDKTSNCWPLDDNHYAEVFAASASFKTDDPPLWSGLLSPSARAAALRETGDIAEVAMKTCTLSETAGTLY